MTDKFYKWMTDMEERTGMFSLDDWETKSPAERRRWAFDKLDLARRYISSSDIDDRPSDEDIFKKADRLIAYINGRHSECAESLSREHPSASGSSEKPGQPLPAATEAPSQSA